MGLLPLLCKLTKMDLSYLLSKATQYLQVVLSLSIMRWTEPWILCLHYTAIYAVIYFHLIRWLELPKNTVRSLHTSNDGNKEKETLIPIPANRLCASLHHLLELLMTSSAWQSPKYAPPTNKNFIRSLSKSLGFKKLNRKNKEGLVLHPEGKVCMNWTCQQRLISYVKVAHRTQKTSLRTGMYWVL